MNDLPTVVIPKDYINLRVPLTYTKVRQLETLNIQPTISAATPVYTVRRNVSATLASINTQIVRNPRTDISRTTVSIQTPNGSLQAQGAANADAPISISVVRSSVPVAISVQANTATGAGTSPQFGNSFSKSINIQ